MQRIKQDDIFLIRMNKKVKKQLFNFAYRDNSSVAQIARKAIQKYIDEEIKLDKNKK